MQRVHLVTQPEGESATSRDAAYGSCRNAEVRFNSGFSQRSALEAELNPRWRDLAGMISANVGGA